MSPCSRKDAPAHPLAEYVSRSIFMFSSTGWSCAGCCECVLATVTEMCGADFSRAPSADCPHIRQVQVVKAGAGKPQYGCGREGWQAQRRGKMGATYSTRSILFMHFAVFSFINPPLPSFSPHLVFEQTILCACGPRLRPLTVFLVCSLRNARAERV